MFSVPFGVMGCGPAGRHPSLNHPTKRPRHGCRTHVDMKDNSTDRNHGSSWMNENSDLTKKPWHDCRPPDDDSAGDQQETEDGLHPEQRLLSGVEASRFRQSREIVHRVAMRKPKPAAVIAVPPHLSSPVPKHRRGKNHKEKTGPWMPRPHGEAAAEHGSEPIEPRRPDRQPRQCDGEEAERHTPVDDAVGDAVA